MFSCLSAVVGGVSVGGSRGKLAARSGDPTACHNSSPSLGDLPDSIIAAALTWCTFAERCQAALVCRQWAAIVDSAAAHSRDQSCVPLAATRLLPCDVDTSDARLAAAGRIGSCRAVRHAPSAALALDDRGAAALQQQLSRHVTRLVVLDPVVVRHMQQHEGEAWVPLVARPPALQLDLAQHRALRVLSVAMSRPLLHVGWLPRSLQALHLDLASGYSAQQLHSLCRALAAAGPALPQLQHISLGLELDTLLSSSHADVLTPLSGLTQLTSLSLVEYQYMHPDSAAHDGYPGVPPVLQLLPRLQHADLHVNSGHKVDLTPAASVPDLHLALTLAHYEQEPFNRLPPSLVSLRGLTSVSILMAEFAYCAEQDLWVFDVGPLAACPHLRRLLLELHGVKASLHDLQGLAQLTGLCELQVLLKCPDVHEARPPVEAVVGAPGSVGGASSHSGGGGGEAVRPGSRSSSGSGFLASMQRMPGRLRSLLDGGSRAGGGVPQQQHACGSSSCSNNSCSGCGGGPQQPGLVSEEWVLALLDHALDQLRPEFALSVPAMPGGRVLIASTSRLCLRTPANLAVAAQPMLLASHLQLDLAAAGDAWSGESFLHRMGPRALHSWASRNWSPVGVELAPPARYPVLGTYPGCTQRIDDALLVAARRGTPPAVVVAAVMAVAEERCLSYFS